MRIRVLGKGGSGLLSDVTVFLVGEKDSKSAAFLADVFPTTVEARADGTIVYPIDLAGGVSPEFVDAVEIESPTLTAILLGVGLLVVGLVVALFLKK